MRSNQEKTLNLGEFCNLNEVLHRRAIIQPDEAAYIFLKDGESVEERITYSQLHRRALAIAKHLSARGAAGDRAVLMYPAGIDYVVAFYGCLYAGIIAVPAYPIDPNRMSRTLPRLLSIIDDCTARFVLTTSELLTTTDAMFELAPDLQDKIWVGTDNLDSGAAEEFTYPSVDRQTTAYLQYTSGSTGSPKGVIITHDNIIEHEIALLRVNQQPADRAVVSWLPIYHDLGLISKIILSLCAGSTCVFMSPMSFLQRPVRWLQAISKYRGWWSGGPNFAYALCASKTTPEQRQQLDLSGWMIAGCGAEPLRANVVNHFISTFAECGFKPQSFCPQYGLAEATLGVSANKFQSPYKSLDVDASAMAQGIIRPATPGMLSSRVVGCGVAIEGVDVEIVDPETRKRCEPDRIGEIWVSGPNVAEGYWEREKETKATFQAYLADTGEGPFLRTGDFGFLQQGELYISSRLKDIVIIRGKNYYPHEIEAAIEGSHASLKAGCSAVFSIEHNDEEKLVVAVEIKSDQVAGVSDRPPGEAELSGFQEVFTGIRNTVTSQFGIMPHAIVLLRSGTIPKTSSGKIQRAGCRSSFIDGSLDIIAAQTDALEESDTFAGQGATQAKADALAKKSASDPELQQWITQWLSQRLSIPASSIDETAPLADMGLDSIGAAELASQLEIKLQRKVPATAAWTGVSVAGMVEEFGAAGKTAGTEVPEVNDESCEAVEPIAIVGMACRFPGSANTPNDFWSLLEGEKNAITRIPARRWDIDEFYSPEAGAPGRTNSRWGGFIDNVEDFDPSFFGISDREAVQMDPQQRLLLEVSWEALESAGIVPARIKGSRTGLYLGICSSDYAQRTISPLSRESIDMHSATGSSLSVASGRVSYLLGFHGPSMSIDTACSSSLVAVHQACQSLRARECTLAIGAGANLILSPEISIAMSQMGALSSGDSCRTFDANADGYVRGEGCGAVVLKRLVDAQRDGDEILAVIRGSAVNQDGRSNGLTAPNGKAQKDVITRALQSAQIDPVTVGYVECHGTATPLGDPIEVASLASVYCAERTTENSLLIGSVKSNIGHTEGAAGIAGLIKAVLSLKKRKIPRSLHFNNPNPEVDWKEIPVSVARKCIDWNGNDEPRRAGVSSFGFSGTNAHLVLEEWPAGEQERTLYTRDDAGDHCGTANTNSYDRHEATTSVAVSSDESSKYMPVVLSGRSKEALRAQAKNLKSCLQSNPELAVSDVAYCLATRRTHFEHRGLIVSDERTRLINSLNSLADGTPDQYTAEGEAVVNGKLVFVFPGQGTQWPGMAKALMETSAAFRQQMEDCARAFSPYIDWQFPEMLAEEDLTAMNRVDVVQPLLFSMMVSLANLWRSMGVDPDAVIGVSQGEVAAAYIAGALSLDDAAKIVALRSQAITALAGQGAMAAVELSPAELAPYLDSGFGESLAISAYTGPRSLLVSGESGEIRSLVARLTEDEIFAREVRVDYASHCVQVEAVREEILSALKDIVPRETRIPMYSTVDGESFKPLKGAGLDALYWFRNLRQPVQFANTVEELVNDGARFFVEVSPHPAMHMALKAVMEQESVDGCVVGTLWRDKGEFGSVLLNLGRLHVQGYALDWKSFDGFKGSTAVALPTYPFQRQRYYLDAPSPKALSHGMLKYSRPGSGKSSAHPLLGPAYSMSAPESVVLWDIAFNRKSQPWVEDHKVQSVCVFPGAAYIEIALSVARELAPRKKITLKNIEFKKPLIINEADEVLAQVSMLPASDSGYSDDRSPGNGSAESQSDISQNGSAWILGVSKTGGGAKDTDASWDRLVSAHVIAEHPEHLDSPVNSDPSVGRSAIHSAFCNSSAIKDAKARCTIPQSVEGTYYRFMEYGLNYGSLFQGLTELWSSEDCNSALGLVALPGLEEQKQSFMIHPALLDACLHVAGAAAMLLNPSLAGPVVPVRIGSLHVARSVGGGPLWCEAVLRPADNITGFIADIALWDEQGEPLGNINHLEAIPLESSFSAGLDKPQESLLAVRWTNSDSLVSLIHSERSTLSSGVSTGKAAENGPTERWLVLADNQGFGNNVVSELRAQGALVEVLYNDAGSVSPLNPLTTIIGSLLNGNEVLSGIICLWGLDSPPMEQVAPDAIVKAGEDGWASALNAVQALITSSPDILPRLVLVTQNSQPISGHPLVRPDQAILWGLGGVIHSEEPLLRSLRVDIGDPKSYEEARSLVAVALSDTREEQIALRSDSLYVPRLEQKTPGALSSCSRASSVDESDGFVLTGKGSYLITGGTGGLGLSLAACLVEQGAEHIVLLGRRGVTNAAQKSAIKDMEARGALVTVVRGDVANIAALESVIDSLPDGYPLRGVVHAAGLLDDGVLADQSVERFHNVMGPKVAGAWNLHLLTRDIELDFFVLYSSSATLVGNPGQSNYASANAFLDALSHYRQQLGLKSLSLNWGAISQVGLAAEQENRGARLEELGFQSLTPEQANDIFLRLVPTSIAQVAPCSVDLAQWLKYSPEIAHWPYLETLLSNVGNPADNGENTVGKVSPNLEKKIRNADEVQLEQLLVEHIIEQIAGVTHIDPARISPTSPFIDLGIDSLMGLEFRNRLNASTGLQLSATVVFRFPDAASLARHMLEQFSVTGPGKNTLPTLGEIQLLEQSSESVSLSDNVAAPSRLPTLAPLSPGQQRLWFLNQVLEKPEVYNVHIGLHVQSGLRLAWLQEALESLVARHEQLRVCFVTRDGIPCQRVLPWVEADIASHDLSMLSAGEQSSALQELSHKLAHKTFDLSRAPLIRLALVRLASDQSAIFVTWHHIATDGYSLAVFLQELFRAYQDAAEGKLGQQVIAAPSYLAYTDQILTWKKSPEAELQREWWKHALAKIQSLKLPLERSLSGPTGNSGGMIHFSLTRALSDEVDQLAQRLGCTSFSLFLSVWSILQYRLSGQTDFAVGTVVSGRLQRELRDAIGFYVNTLPIPVHIEGISGFDNFVRQSHDKLLEALDHQMLPFDEIVQQAPINDGQKLEAAELFRSVIVLEEGDWFADSFAALGRPVRPLTRSVGGNLEDAVKFDLSITLAGSNDGYIGSLGYAADKFDGSAAERMLEQFKTLLQSVIDKPNEPVAKLEMLSKAERHKVLELFNDTQAIDSGYQTILDMFAAQVACNPDNVAVICGETTLTFGELNAQANQLAHYLQSIGVGPETRVGICLERNMQLPVALLGTLKAGGAFVPLDPSYPQARLDFMVEDSSPLVLLTQAALKTRWLHVCSDTKVIELDGQNNPWERLTQVDPDRQTTGLSPEHQAYVIYTSGSTGLPKGVMIEHRALVNYLSWITHAYYQEYQGGSPTVFSISFDGGITTTFGALMAGQPLTMLAAGDEIASLGQGLKQETPYTLLKVTPSHLKAINQGLDHSNAESPTRALMTGGEAMVPEDVSFWQQRYPGVRLINHFGPTEATVGCATFEITEDVSEWQSIPIGRPIQNVQLYILNESLEPQPIGVPGQLYIAGSGLARGYVNRPELTAERFLANPFGKPGARMYATGDLCRWREDGNIEYLGRLDHQVKIRGFRIELGEIEACLAKYPAVNECVCVAHEDSAGHKRLIAYLMADKSQEEVSVSDLRSYLSENMPEYMIPNAFVFVDKWPLTNNGKLDRKALPIPEFDRSQLGQAYKAPDNASERSLVTIWSELLQLDVDTIGVHDNFFDLGGHSLLLLEMSSRILAEFSVELGVRALFEAQTIRELATKLEDTGCNDTAPAIDLVKEVESLPVIAPQWNNVRSIKAAIQAPKRILLTGATGFVGAHLLFELVSAFQCRVACLVRADTNEDGLDRIKQVFNDYEIQADARFWDNVSIVCGDLSQQSFGLSQAKIDRLCDRIESIVHVAALVDHLRPYSMLKDANVMGTLEALRLAASGQPKTIHLVSTMGVWAPESEADLNNGVSESWDIPVPRATASGYTHSKWVAEQLARKASEAGLPVVLHRPGLVWGDMKSGALPLKHYWFTSALKACTLVKGFPHKQWRNGIAVNDLCRAIAYRMMSQANKHDVFNFSLPVDVEEGQMNDIFAQFGVPAEPLEYAEWRSRVINLADKADDDGLRQLAMLLPEPSFIGTPGYKPFVHNDNARELVNSSVNMESNFQKAFLPMLKFVERKAV